MKLKNVLSKFMISTVAITTLMTGSAFAKDTYKLDPVHSSVVFKIKHMGVTNVYGRFNDISGSVEFDEKNLNNSKVDLIVKTESVYTDNKKRDDHLRSPDFFNSKQFPVITFKSKSIKSLGNNKYKVKGDLSLHGVTKEIEIDFERFGTTKDPWGNMRTGGETVFTIDRTDFGVNYMRDILGDKVTLMIGLEGVMK